MKTQSTRVAFFNLRIVIGSTLCLTGVLIGLTEVSRSVTGAIATTPAANAHHQHHHYKLIDTGTLGGPTSSLGFEGERDINNRGTVVSLAETTIPDPYAPNCLLSDCFLGHAVNWKGRVLTDLGALPT